LFLPSLFPPSSSLSTAFISIQMLYMMAQSPADGSVSALPEIGSEKISQTKEEPPHLFWAAVGVTPAERDYYLLERKSIFPFYYLPLIRVWPAGPSTWGGEHRWTGPPCRTCLRR